MYKLQVTADKLNIRNSPSADPTYANWVGDMNNGEIFTAVKKVKGDTVDGSDDWYEDNFNRYIAASCVQDATGLLVRFDYNILVTNISEDARKTFGKNMTVVIMDTGISNDHKDISIKPLNYFNFCDDSENKFDQVGHGTKVAGIIGGCAINENDIGICGLAPSCEMISYKITNDGSTDPLNIQKAMPTLIQLAQQSKAIIVNCSWAINQSQALDDLFKTVPENVVFICAAGNNSDLLSQNDSLFYPASLPRMISVGYINKNLFSSILSSGSLNPSLDFLYIGDAVKSCDIPNTDSYSDFDKCSMSTAILSGIATLLLSTLPNGAVINTGFVRDKLNSQLLSIPNIVPEDITIYKLK